MQIARDAQDEEISARYPGHFVQTNWKNLLSREDADRAAEILKKPSFPMNFPSEERVRQAVLQAQSQPNENEAPMECSIS